MIQLRPEERGLVTRYLQSLCGLSLDASKDYLVEGRLGGLATEAGCTTFSQFVSLAQGDRSSALPRRIVDAITTGETLFFRDTAPFDLLRHKIVPELIDRRKRGANSGIRIWSAACSTGQELYSIAIVLKELLGDPERYGIRLVGTDISDAAISRASRGWYGAVEMSRGLPPELHSRYFLQHQDGWKICDEIRAMVSFQKANLLRDFSALGRFDVIFCRNVAIYFSNEDRKSLFDRMGRALEPGGALIIGAMESLSGICPQFESKRHMRAIYYQVRTS